MKVEWYDTTSGGRGNEGDEGGEDEVNGNGKGKGRVHKPYVGWSGPYTDDLARKYHRIECD